MSAVLPRAVSVTIQGRRFDWSSSMGRNSGNRTSLFPTKWSVFDNTFVAHHLRMGTGVRGMWSNLLDCIAAHEALAVSTALRRGLLSLVTNERRGCATGGRHRRAANRASAVALCIAHHDGKAILRRTTGRPFMIC